MIRLAETSAYSRLCFIVSLLDKTDPAFRADTFSETTSTSFFPWRSKEGADGPINRAMTMMGGGQSQTGLPSIMHASPTRIHKRGITYTQYDK